MGNQIAPLGVNYDQANALGDSLNLPYFYASVSNNILSGANKMFDRISVPGFTLNKKRAMTRSYSQDERPIVPPWGQRRLKRSTINNSEIKRAQQEDEVMRGREVFESILVFSYLQIHVLFGCYFLNRNHCFAIFIQFQGFTELHKD